MSTDDRATSPRLVRGLDAVDPARLAGRLGDWTRGGASLATGLARALRALIASGELRPGDRLPAERTLAAAVTVSRGTVVAAYAALSEEGVLERRQGSGTRVAGHALGMTQPDRASRGAGLFTSAPTAIDLLRAVPALSEPAVELLRAHVPAIDLTTLSETDPAGIRFVRERIAALITADGTPTTAEQVLVTHGGQQAISLVVDELVTPGDAVITEAITWPGFADSVRRRGGRVVGVPMDAHGIDVEALEAAIVAFRPVLVGLNPHHHNPTGTRLSPERRMRVAELAAEYGVPVLEDRVLAHVSFDGVVPPTLAALRPDAPILVADSVSKWSWSGLRVGWLRADPVLVRRLRGVRQFVDQSTSVPAQLVAVDFLDNAELLRREVSRIHAGRARRVAELVAEQLPGWRLDPPAGGLSAWAQLPAGSATELARIAAVRGVAVGGSSEFAASDSLDDHIRLPFTAPEPVLEEGIARLAGAWREYRGGA